MARRRSLPGPADVHTHFPAHPSALPLLLRCPLPLLPRPPHPLPLPEVPRPGEGWVSWGPLFSGRLTPIPPRPRGSGRPVLLAAPPHPGFLTWLEVNGPQHFRHMLHAQGELIHSFIARLRRPWPAPPSTSSRPCSSPAAQLETPQHHYPRFPPLSVESLPTLSSPSRFTYSLIDQLLGLLQGRKEGESKHCANVQQYPISDAHHCPAG